MQLRNEIGTRGGTVDSMERENKNKRKKRGRKGREISGREGFTKAGKDETLLLGGWGHCSWLAPSHWNALDTCHDNCPGHMAGEPLISLSMSSVGPSQGVT